MRRLTRGVIRRLLPPRLREAFAAYRGLPADVPVLTEVPPGERVLVLAPHMDDEVIGCGGTLVKHAERGCALAVAILTDGALGDPAAEAAPMPEEARRESRRALCEIRREESRAAAKVLGVEELVFLDCPDGGLTGSPTARVAVERLVGEYRPDVLYAPFVTDAHPDHRAAARLVAGLASRRPELLVAAYEVWTPLHPTCLVDITAQAERKTEALACFQSQLSHNDFRHTALGLNAYRSMFHLSGRGFAEAFFAAPARVHAALAEMLDRGRESARP